MIQHESEQDAKYFTFWDPKVKPLTHTLHYRLWK